MWLRGSPCKYVVSGSVLLRCTFCKVHIIKHQTDQWPVKEFRWQNFMEASRAYVRDMCVCVLLCFSLIALTGSVGLFASIQRKSSVTEKISIIFARQDFYFFTFLLFYFSSFFSYVSLLLLYIFHGRIFLPKIYSGNIKGIYHALRSVASIEDKEYVRFFF